MKIIAHRCNLNGPSPAENTIDAMMKCFERGFMVEIDIRLIDGKLYLGHDGPQEEVELQFLLKHGKKIFIHCKNIEALLYLKAYNNTLNVFGLSRDPFVLTSGGDVFCAVGIVGEGCVCVMPELHIPGFSDEDFNKFKYILPDYPHGYNNENYNHTIWTQ